MADPMSEPDAVTWLQEVERVLRGADRDTVLSRHYPLGLTVPTLHARDSRAGNWPGQSDRRRGFRAQHEPWLVGQFLQIDQPVDTQRLKNECDEGVQAWHLLSNDARDADIDSCLDTIGSSGSVDLNGHSVLIERAFARGPQTCINANFDPYADALDSGFLHTEDEIGSRLEALLSLTHNSALGHRAIACNGARYHASGASDDQELAVIFATCASWLRHGDTLGSSIADTMESLVVRLAATVDPVACISKIRALRAGLTSICHHCGDPSAAEHVRIHAVPATRELTRTGPWVNALRSSAMTLGAALGGADALFTATHDDSDTAEARRLARNTQLVLRDESGLHRVQDPAGGSGQIEAHTDALLHSAWSLFQQIESDGGIPAALGNTTLQQSLVSQARVLKARTATRERAVTGVNIHPDPQSPSCAVAHPPDAGDLACPTVRLSDDFDQLRLAALEQPVCVHLRALSQSAGAAARIAFCQNLLAAGGIKTRTDEFCSDGIAILCGSNDDIDQIDSSTITALSQDGYSRIYVAGAPPETEAALKPLGVHAAVRSGLDAVAFLNEIQAYEATT